MKIIGITGTTGAGKGTVVEYLSKKQGFKHYSAREFIISEMDKAGIEVNLENITDYANKLRARYSPSIIVEKLYEKAVNNKENAIIESIRTVGEIDALRAKGNFILVGVDADINKRYDRVKLRNTELDDISYDEFKKINQKQNESPDPNKQNLSECMKLANFTLDNNSSIDDLYKQIDSMLCEIKKEATEKYVRPNWDEYFMEITRTVAKRATCNRGRSGCIITKNRQILVSGYVGSPVGAPHCDDVGHKFKKTIHEDGSITNHCVRTVHAEQNAICQAAKLGISIQGATLYCKMTPCRVCAMLIINCGIKKVVCEKKYHAGLESEQMFADAGIELVFFDNTIEEYVGQKCN